MEVTRVEQRAYIKIAILRERNAMECHSELVKTLGNNALPHRTVARWIGKFQQGCVSTSDEQQWTSSIKYSNLFKSIYALILQHKVGQNDLSIITFQYFVCVCFMSSYNIPVLEQWNSGAGGAACKQKWVEPPDLNREDGL
ncbi:HTH_48 domain-containing protein [Trichonephila clavipes]|nr:HTH_48 domain-containing protein [Trichonephila clavipes]